MSKDIGPRERALREMREARFERQKTVEAGIRKAAAAGKEVLDRSVRETAERMKNKPAKKKARKK